jgi:uncharacterized protein YeaO (DUF488 family)
MFGPYHATGDVTMLKLHTYQLGTPRRRGEGLRVGVVRHLPRGVRKQDYARLNQFDVWFPTVAPSAELVHWLRADPEARWTKFVERYTREMQQPHSRHAIKLLAELARRTPISIGCFCADESHCHRSILRRLIEQAASE